MEQNGKMLICIMHIQGHEINNTMLTVSFVVSGKLGRTLLSCMIVWWIGMKRIVSQVLLPLNISIMALNT